MSDEPNLVVKCPKCDRHVAGAENGRLVVYDDEAEDALVHILLSCPECKSPFLLRTAFVRYQDRNGMRAQDWYSSEVVFPSSEATLDESVPTAVAESYREAYRTFSMASAHTATAIMCRRTLEGICSHLGATDRTLAGKLATLHKEGKIEKRIHDWSTEVLKNLGNDAAHDVTFTIGAQDAKDALEFTRAVIEYLFVFQSSFDRFKARQAERKSKSKSKSESQ